mmetsp:Transcript_128947/g.181890  ORF Transcript_128947/g.181890 Transcript_128947/m.181890 type:complete len:478 (-) Transcript_128947:100-1533(-)
MMLEDPQLLKARPRDQWKPGSAIEVNYFDSKWGVGYIVTQDQGIFVIFMSDTLSYRHVPLNDSSLAPLGRHIRELPPGWEVRGGTPPQLAPKGYRLGRACATLEDAWAAHLEQQFHKAQQGTRPSRPEASPTQLKGSPASSPQPVATAKPASNIVSFQVQTEMTVDVTLLDREALIARLREAEARNEELQRHIFQLREEREDRQRRLDEALFENARLHGLNHRSVSQSSLPTSPSQRMLVTSPQPLQPSNSSGFIKSEASALPPVPNSWQPPTSARETPGRSTLSPVSADGDGEEGDMFPGPDFNCNNFRSTQPLASMASVPAAAPPPARISEKPVEIVVSVPRAPVDEMEAPAPILAGPHPCRSLQSLQKNTHVPLVLPHQVTRLPSAPAPQSQAFAAGPVQVACGNGYTHHHHLARGLLPSGLLPSAPASLAAPAGNRVVAPRNPIQVAQAPMQQAQAPPPAVVMQACVSVSGYR